MPTALRVLFLFIFLKPPVAYFRGCAFLSRHSMRLWSHLPFDLFQRWRISEGVFWSKTRHSTLSSFWVLCYTIQLSLTSKILSFFLIYFYLSTSLIFRFDLVAKRVCWYIIASTLHVLQLCISFLFQPLTRTDGHRAVGSTAVRPVLLL
jgi:hypothetical protein